MASGYTPRLWRFVLATGLRRLGKGLLMRQPVYPAGLTELGRLLLVAPLPLAWTIGPARQTRATKRSSVRVALVDSCSTFRKGLRHAIEEASGVDVVGECESAEDALDWLSANEADVAVVDIDLPRQSGIELCRRLALERPGVPVLLLSERDWDVYLAAARAARAHGFLVRQMPTAQLVRSIRDSNARPLFTTEQLDRIGNWHATVGQPLITLSPRQWDVLWLVAAGKSNREIADCLSLTESTVEKHIGAILEKLHVPSRAGLLALILRNHLDVLKRNHFDVFKG